MQGAAILYHPEGYTTRGPRLMGRHAAGESFLRGFIVHGQSDEFQVRVENREHAEKFLATVRSFGHSQPVHVIMSTNLGDLAKPGMLYLPGPDLSKQAWLRTTFGDDAWSLCGITHTTSSAGVMDGLANLLVAPVQPWDAIICTSTAVQENVSAVIQGQVEYLRARLGIGEPVLPRLPVIPLGIHTADFQFSQDQRAAARQKIGVDDDTLVVLFAGRLSFHAKAHPLAMYQALETASRDLTDGGKVVLIECGWHSNDYIKNAFAAAASAACPSVRVINLDGRQADNMATAWAGADIFCSLSDNFQETFGITPIEAMAVGLPVVVSDWDGYKDTVRHDIDGFRIPTIMPAPGLGEDLARRHGLETDTYDQYIGYSCSFVAVDVEAAARAFGRLFASRQLRESMGAAGKIRAREIYDWEVIIPAYQALWGELSEIRRTMGPKHKRLALPWPARMDPFGAFAAYPSQTLTDETMLELAGFDLAAAVRRTDELLKLKMVRFAGSVLPTRTEIKNLLKACADGPIFAAEMVASIDRQRRPFVFRALVWLLKLGVLRIPGTHHERS